jgi:hypothetical protein
MNRLAAYLGSMAAALPLLGLAISAGRASVLPNTEWIGNVQESPGRGARKLSLLIGTLIGLYSFEKKKNELSPFSSNFLIRAQKPVPPLQGLMGSVPLPRVPLRFTLGCSVPRFQRFRCEMPEWKHPP